MIRPFIEVITPFITSRGPPCTICIPLVATLNWATKKTLLLSIILVLSMVCYSPHLTGWYNPLDTLNNQGFFIAKFCWTFGICIQHFFPRLFRWTKQQQGSRWKYPWSQACCIKLWPSCSKTPGVNKQKKQTYSDDWKRKHKQKQHTCCLCDYVY